MGRPVKEGCDYFPHDTDAATDEKIEILRAAHRNDGCAFYFILLERIYRTANGEIVTSGPEMRQQLIKRVGVSPKKFEAMMDTALRWGCFDRESYNNGILTSKEIKHRFAFIAAKRQEERDRYHRRVSGGVSGSETIPDTTPESAQAKERKERKEKHSSLARHTPCSRASGGSRLARAAVTDADGVEETLRLRASLKATEQTKEM